MRLLANAMPPFSMPFQQVGIAVTPWIRRVNVRMNRRPVEMIKSVVEFVIRLDKSDILIPIAESSSSQT